MAIKYVPTTKEIDISKETEIILDDKDYMIYEMLKDILIQLKKVPRG